MPSSSPPLNMMMVCPIEIAKNEKTYIDLDNIDDLILIAKACELSASGFMLDGNSIASLYASLDTLTNICTGNTSDPHQISIHNYLNIQQAVLGSQTTDRKGNSKIKRK